MQLDLRYPYCITGVIPEQLRDQASQLSQRQVTLTVIPYAYETLQRVDAPLATRRVVDGIPTANWCFGEYVYLLVSID